MPSPVPISELAKKNKAERFMIIINQTKMKLIQKTSQDSSIEIYDNDNKLVPEPPNNWR